MPQEAGQRFEDMREAVEGLHERLSEIRRAAWSEQGRMQGSTEETLETLLERQGEMLEAIQDLAGALDVWVSTSQTILERYLPQLVRLLVNERS